MATKPKANPAYKTGSGVSKAAMMQNIKKNGAKQTAAEAVGKVKKKK